MNTPQLKEHRPIASIYPHRAARFSQRPVTWCKLAWLYRLAFRFRIQRRYPYPQALTRLDRKRVIHQAQRLVRKDSLRSAAATLLLTAHGVAMAGFTPLGPYLVPEWRLTPLAFALLAATYPLAAALALHALAVTRRAGLVMAGGLLFLCLVATALAPNPVALCSARALAGFMGGILVATVAPRRSALLASVLAMPLLLIVAWLGGWRIALGIAAALAAAGAVLGAHCAPPRPPRLTPPRARLPGALMAFAGTAMGTFMSGALVLNAGLSLAQLPLAFLAGAFLLALATPHGTLHSTAAPLPALARLLLAKATALGLLAALPLGSPTLALAGAGLFVATNALRSVPLDRLLGPPEKRQHACLHLATGLGMLTAGVCVSLSPQGQLAGLPFAAFLGISALAMAWILVYRLSERSLDQM